MAIEIHPGLHIGSMVDCRMPDAVTMFAGTVHAAKYPCHAQLLGYDVKGGRCPPEHPEYLIARRPRHLVLNMIDPPVPLYFSVAQFTAALDFIDAITDGPVLIHCNQGWSRAPSIALLHMAKRARVLPGETYEDAAQAFLMFYATYRPGEGIAAFLREHWKEIA